MSLVTDELQLPFAYYRIYSINRPGRLLNFWTLRVGAYSRWALIRGWALIRINTVFEDERIFCTFVDISFTPAKNETRKTPKRVNEQ